MHMIRELVIAEFKKYRKKKIKGSKLDFHHHGKKEHDSKKIRGQKVEGFHTGTFYPLKYFSLLKGYWDKKHSGIIWRHEYEHREKIRAVLIFCMEPT